MNEKIQNLEARLAALDEGNLSAEQVDVLNELAWEMRYGDAKRALTLSHRAREISSTISYPKGLAYSLRNSGICNWLLARYEPALAEAHEALRLFENCGDDYGRAHALNVIGNVHERLGNHANSLDCHSQSLRIRESINDLEGVATSLNNLGNVHFSTGELGLALNYYLKSLKSYEEIENVSGISRASNNIGNVYRRLGEYNKALEHLSRALKIKQETGDRQNEALVLINIGDVHDSLGDQATALDYYHRSLASTQGAGDRQAEAASLSDIGNVYKKQGDYEKALHYYSRSLEIAREIGVKYFESEALINLGETFIHFKREAEALAHLTQALSIAEEIKSNELIYKAHHALSQTYEQLGDFSNALEHHKAFYKWREQVFGEEAAQKIKSVAVQFEVEKSQKEAEIYRLKNVELAHAYRNLQEADEQKTGLVEQLRRQAEELDRLSKEDGLTGLFNRRYFDAQLAQEFERARRFKRNLAIVIADLDNFKYINDQFSHQIGDEVLRRVARILKENSRRIDLVARYGGEEFVKLFIETDAERAAMACEKARAALEEYDWRRLHPALKVTVSMGVADDLTVETPEAFLSAADAKLYEAKQSGRNQVRY